MSDLDTATEPSPPGRRRVRRALAVAVALAVLAGGGAALVLRDDGTTASDAKTKRAAQPVDEDEAQRRARSTGDQVEVATLTDEFSTTYANPDGTFTYEASVAPVRAKNAKGRWAPIDTSLRADDEGWHTVNSPYPVTFSAGGKGGGTAKKAGARASGATDTSGSGNSGSRNSGSATTVQAAVFRAGSGSSGTEQIDDDATSWTPLLTMTAEGHEIGFEWPGTLPEPVVEDNRALYEGVLPGVDLMLSARDTGFTHVLVVHTPEAATRLAADPPRYRVTSPTLSFTLDPGTDVLMAKDKDGTETAVSPTPFLWDSAGAHDTDTASADPDAATGANEDPEVVEKAPARETDTPADEVPNENPDAPRTTEPGAEEAGAEDAGAEDAGAQDAGAEDSGVDPVAYEAAGAASDTLALPAVNGPGEGAHATEAAAAFEDGVLTVTPPGAYLADTEDLTYPLFLDPSTTGIRANWTTVYKRYPGSSFYDGANYNEDTKEARVGFEKQTWGTARSFFRMKLKNSIKGADVSSATLKVLETHSWSCSKRTVQLWRTGDFTSKTTWNRQPDWKRKITSKSFAYGWKSNSSCPDANVNFTVTTLAQDAADDGLTSFNVGLVASTSSSAPTGSSSSLETDTYSWKKFQAEGGGSPTLSITYNRKPNTPTSVTMSPGSCDTSASPYIKVGKADTITISGKATDPDGVLSKLEFELWQTGKADTTKKTFTKSIANGEVGGVSIRSSLTTGVTYSWRVRAWDDKASSGWAPTGGDGVCRFTYDTDLPDSPAPVVSTDFPGDDDGNSVPDVWSDKPFGNSGSFTFAVGSSSETDIVKFVWSINSTNYAGYACAGGSQGTSGGLTKSCTTAVKTATVTGIKPPSAGPNTLYVKSVDTAGNISPNARKYFFYVKPRSTADGPGDLNGDGTADFAHVTAAGNLWIDSVSQNGDWISSAFGTHDKGTLIKDGGTAPHIWNGADTYALVTHNGDFAPGDGVTDWVIRTPDGRLFVYPGDGYGAIDVSKRIEVRLPANAPDPSTFSEIKSAGDITGDGQPELFVAGGAAGAELWILSGYSGGSFSEATQMTTTSWADADRDFVAIADYNGDGAADMTYRTAAGNLVLRKGILDSDGVGTVLKSLGQSGWSLDGDDTYAAGTFTRAAFPKLYGSPDTAADGLPDIWATNAAGALLLYEGGATAVGSATTLRSSGWDTIKQLG
ncbi:DNRLRE domain-containing protein [Streptomyces sp. NBC_01275]|uniref:DNRLRE domain-containing protein n=1 Tax=Streptomyces sp. NBC_01275 TaxID=2903807 RepID=UPI00225B1533|nr:DNRLRE domain-containing protein [Streptomyces sp. NBC_01275]MCX4763980.1 DNRLRE domain-containing protein [Streptomyces sp. NBC_01275]